MCREAILGQAIWILIQWNANSEELTIQSSEGTVGGFSDNLMGVFFPSYDATIDFMARVTPLGGSYGDQAGIMMRKSLTANSAHASMALSGASLPTMSIRIGTGGFALSTAGVPVSTPYWLHLYRLGGTITGYVSPDGVAWTTIMTYPNVLTNPLYLGLFSIHNGGPGTATFDHISINGSPLREGEMAFEKGLMLTAAPNPFQKEITLSIEHLQPNERVTIRLSNILGQQVYGLESATDLSGGMERRLAIEGLPAGTYLLEVRAGAQRKALKVVKQ